MNIIRTKSEEIRKRHKNKFVSFNDAVVCLYFNHEGDIAELKSVVGEYNYDLLNERGFIRPYITVWESTNKAYDYIKSRKINIRQTIKRNYNLAFKDTLRWLAEKHMWQALKYYFLYDKFEIQIYYKE